MERETADPEPDPVPVPDPGFVPGHGAAESVSYLFRLEPAESPPRGFSDAFRVPRDSGRLPFGTALRVALRSLSTSVPVKSLNWPGEI